MTEVRDVNDIAPSEAGSSSGGAEGGHHSVRSKLNQGSLRSQAGGGGGNSLRQNHHHHHQAQQPNQRAGRQQSHNRQYKLCRDQTLDPPVSPASPSPEMKPRKPKPRGFKLWKSRDQGEVLIQLEPLKAKKKQRKMEEDKPGGHPIAPAAASTTTDSQQQERLLQGCSNENQLFLSEDEKEGSAGRDKGLMEEADAGTKLLPVSSQQGQTEPDAPILLHSYSDKINGTVPTSGEGSIPNGDCKRSQSVHDPADTFRAAFKSTNVNGSCRTDDSILPADHTLCGSHRNPNGTPQPPGKTGGEWSMVTMNGGSHHILKDSSGSTKDLNGSVDSKTTADLFLGGSRDCRDNTPAVKMSSVKNNNQSVNSQYAGLVQAGSCVQL